MKKAVLTPFQITSHRRHTNETPLGIKMIRAKEIWNESQRGKGVVIAVLDTGCQKDHPALKDNIIDGYNFTSENNRDPHDYTDTNGHGTHVAGIIAAKDTGRGVVGVAPQAKLLILKVMDEDGGGSYQNIIKGLYYAMFWKGPDGERVRVISMSLGGTNDNYKLHKAVIRAVQRDILVVCAAGNLGDGDAETEEKHYPGAYAEVMQVGAVDSDKKIAYFSNTNNEVDLVAPGVEIMSTYLDSGYASMSGTSMAAPHVAGAAALIINQCERDFERRLSEAEIYAQLCKRTIPLGFKKSEEGNGLLVLTEGY